MRDPQPTAEVAERERVCVKRVCVCFGGVCWGVSMCFERRVCNNGPARPTHLLLGTVVWREAMVVLSVMLMVMFPGCAHITTHCSLMLKIVNVSLL